MPDNVSLSLRLSPQLIADLKKMADEFGLSVNTYIRVALIGHVLNKQQGIS